MAADLFLLREKETRLGCIGEGKDRGLLVQRLVGGRKMNVGG